MDDYRRLSPCSSSPRRSPRSSRLRNVQSPRHSPRSSRLWNVQSPLHLRTSAELETEAESATMEGSGASYLVDYLMDKDGKRATHLLQHAISSSPIFFFLSSALPPPSHLCPPPSAAGGSPPPPCRLKLCRDTFVGVVLTPAPTPTTSGWWLPPSRHATHLPLPPLDPAHPNPRAGRQRALPRRPRCRPCPTAFSRCPTEPPSRAAGE